MWPGCIQFEIDEFIIKIQTNRKKEFSGESGIFQKYLVQCQCDNELIAFKMPWNLFDTGKIYKMFPRGLRCRILTITTYTNEADLPTHQQQTKLLTKRD
jgi:hypothetical protein